MSQQGPFTFDSGSGFDTGYFFDDAGNPIPVQTVTVQPRVYTVTVPARVYTVTVAAR